MQKILIFLSPTRGFDREYLYLSLIHIYNQFCCFTPPNFLCFKGFLRIRKSHIKKNLPFINLFDEYFHCQQMNVDTTFLNLACSFASYPSNLDANLFPIFWLVICSKRYVMGGSLKFCSTSFVYINKVTASVQQLRTFSLFNILFIRMCRRNRLIKKFVQFLNSCGRIVRYEIFLRCWYFCLW